MMKKRRKNWVDDVFKRYKTKDANKVWRKILETSRCSTIIKVLKDRE